MAAIHRLTVYVTSEDKKRVEKMALSFNKHASEYARDVLLAQVAVDEDRDTPRYYSGSETLKATKS